MEFKYINLKFRPKYFNFNVFHKKMFCNNLQSLHEEIAVLWETLQTILKWVESSLQPLLFIFKVSTNTNLTEIQ